MVPHAPCADLGGHVYHLTSKVHHVCTFPNCMRAPPPLTCVCTTSLVRWSVLASTRSTFTSCAKLHSVRINRLDWDIHELLFTAFWYMRRFQPRVCWRTMHHTTSTPKLYLRNAPTYHADKLFAVDVHAGLRLSLPSPYVRARVTICT